MPLIHIKTSIKDIKDIKFLQEEVSSALSSITGKSENYIMTIIEKDIEMTFSGNSSPCCFIEVKSIGGLKQKSRQCHGKCPTKFH